MDFIDAILNLAAVLLFLQWRSLRAAHPPVPTRSLLALLQPTNKPLASTRVLMFLAGLLLVRALFYWQIGAPLGWIAHLAFGTLRVPFHSEHFGLMLLYSALAGMHAIVVMFFWLLLFSVVNRRVPDSEAFQKWVRLHLGGAERLPAAVKLLLPIFATALAWAMLHPLFVWLKLLPAARSAALLAGEAAVVGAGAVLVWIPLLLGVLGLHVIQSYVYFGPHPFWKFIEVTGRGLLRPFTVVPLRVGRLDAAPFAVMALVWFAGWWLAHPRWGLPQLLQRLPF